MTASTATTRQVVATCIGNALEWYDFTIYGFMAVTISKLFFPPGAEGDQQRRSDHPLRSAAQA